MVVVCLISFRSLIIDSVTLAFKIVFRKMHAAAMAIITLCPMPCSNLAGGMSRLGNHQAYKYRIYTAMLHQTMVHGNPSHVSYLEPYAGWETDIVSRGDTVLLADAQRTRSPVSSNGAG